MKTSNLGLGHKVLEANSNLKCLLEVVNLFSKCFSKVVCVFSGCVHTCDLGIN